MSYPESHGPTGPDVTGSESRIVGPIEQDNSALLAADPDTLRRRMQELLETRKDLDPGVAADEISELNQALLVVSARHVELEGTSGMPSPKQE